MSKSLNFTSNIELYNNSTPYVIFRLYSQSGCVFECQLLYGQKESKSDCTPWFFPSTCKNTLVPSGKCNCSIVLANFFCDPWQTKHFLDKMRRAPPCSHCLPDCESTIYTSSVSATPLRRCDTKNIGMTPLCSFEEDMALPTIWSHQVTKLQQFH